MTRLIGSTAPLRTFWFIFTLSCLVRGVPLVAGMVPGEYLRPHGEIGRVAVSLARSGQYANPYMIPTGPTAHPTPAYTGFLGLVYSVFGVTETAGRVIALLAIVSYAALNAMLPWLGERLGLGRQAGLLAGIASALIPQQGIWEIIGGADQPFPGIALGLIAIAFLRRWSGGPCSVGSSLLLGIACGAALHLSPPLVLVLLGWTAFELVWSTNRRKYVLAGCIALGTLLACLPWAWRNYATFHQVPFVRSNFGLELRIANHDGADADIDVTGAREKTLRHPSENPEEARMVLELGEIEYMRRAEQEALTWIKGHPAAFTRLTLMRVAHFWCGPLRRPWLAAPITAVTILALLGLRRRLPALAAEQRAALLIPLAAFPLVYYVVSYVPHYRAPVEWLLLLLAGSEVWHWVGQRAVEA